MNTTKMYETMKDDKSESSDGTRCVGKLKKKRFAKVKIPPCVNDPQGSNSRTREYFGWAQ